MNKKGVVLVATYSVLLALLIMAGAIFARAYNTSAVSARLKDNANALYAANQGIAFAYMEAKAASFNWVTYQNKTTPLTPLGFTLPTAIGGNIDTDGLYYIPGYNFRVKAFIDSGNLVIMSKATSGSCSRVVEVKLTSRPLTDYFLFVAGSPRTYSGQAKKLTFNPKISAIYDFKNSTAHSNGDIEFCNGATLLNVTEMTCRGSVYYCVNPYVPSSLTNSTPYIYWEAPYNTTTNYIDDRDIYMGGAGYWHGAPAASVNGIPLPANFSTSYLWNKWLYPTYPDHDFPGYPSSEPAAVNLNIDNMNSGRQATDWINFITTSALNSTIKDKNLGGYFVAPPKNLVTRFSDLAKNGGLFIGSGAGGTSLGDLTLNPGGHSVVRPVFYRNAVFTSPESVLYESGIGNCTKTYDVDVGMLRTWLALNKPTFNGVMAIGSGYGLAGGDASDTITPALINGFRFSNATEIPSPGLTIYSTCTSDIELKGDYNIVNWKPSMVITERLLYTLSNDFNTVGDPALWTNPTYPVTTTPPPRPALVHNLEYPYVTDASNWTSYYTNTTYGTTKMPDKVNNDTTYNVAIVTYWDPTGYELERWAYPTQADGSDAGTPATWTYKKKTMNGSFIIMANPDIGTVNSGKRGRTNPGLPQAIQHSNMTISYDDRLKTQKPPGDISGGYWVSWRQLSASDF